MSSQIVLDTKIVGDIKGTFYVPSYQRGYRWGTEEVMRLLTDIYENGKNPYCLQPVVVRKIRDNTYELIDGQQRLTTLFLIYKFMTKINPIFMGEQTPFEITYQTRENSEEFLKTVDMEKRDENIDFWHIANAYETIENWFKGDLRNRFRDIDECFDNYVKIIWYEISADEDAISLFTRLNVGKIALTGAELVKALFLKAGGLGKDRQEEISLQWDNIERELHNDSLWDFLSNSDNEETRIDLVLDLIAEKPRVCREKYYTFFKIAEKKPDWEEIQQTFLILKNWFEDHEFYHKIGYLIASEKMTLQEIYNISREKTKSEFRASLNDMIRKSIDIGEKNYGDLRYGKDNKTISRLLLLFNVISVYKQGEKARFPFSQFKTDKKNVSWSLEHIHAQNSQGLNKEAAWKDWLRFHIPSLLAVSKDKEINDMELIEKLVGEMQTAVNKTPLTETEFAGLRKRAEDYLSADGNSDNLDSIGNLALLSITENAVLNNSTFDVKRNFVVKMDKAGAYIPYCTKMVFLKYYTPSEESQIHFWGKADRINYIKHINEVLKEDMHYLAEEIRTEEMENGGK